MHMRGMREVLPTAVHEGMEASSPASIEGSSTAIVFGETLRISETPQ